MKCVEKIQGGKLVCIEVLADKGLISRVKITGDFFLHPEERIEKLENALIGQMISISESEATIFFEKALGDAILIGVSCDDLARMMRKAIS